VVRTDRGDPRDAWSRIGTGAPAVLEAVELWWVELPFRRSVTTATTTYSSRPLVMVRVSSTTAAGPVDGWGECAALGDTGYVDEDVGTAFTTLERALGPALVERTTGERGRLPTPAGLTELAHQADRGQMAFAALEMAVADAHLRVERRSLASVLGVEGQSVEAGAVLGTFPTTGELLDAVGALVDQGYHRLKLKIAPGWDVEPVAAVADAFPALAVQVDANGSYREPDGAHLAELDRYRLLCIEQPFGADELEAHARLGSRLQTPICLDESLDGPARVTEALEMGACSVVCVKPARLGGIGAALEVVAHCARAGTPMWIGGMFESGYARGVNAVLSALDGFSWPGDLSPAGGARGYLADDVRSVPDQAGRPTAGGDRSALVALPGVPGMGPAPDPDHLATHLVRRTTLAGDRAHRG
jgi:O-succinylbenzoate synthase